MAQAPTAHVPPQNIDAEESVLGAMLVFEPAITKVIDEVKLKATDFYLDRHRVIFGEVYALYEASKPVDELTVTEALTQHNRIKEAGGKEYVSELAAKVPAAGNAKHYAEIVQENSLLRRLLEAGQSIQGWVNERGGEPRQLSERAERLLFDVAHSEQASDFREVREILSDELDRLEKLSTGENEVTGTPSGFRDLDAITGGFQPGNLIIVAARPAMGKCLAGSTLIYDPTTGHRRRLDDVVTSVQEGRDAWVASLGPDMKLRTSRVSAAESNGVKPTFALRTKLGKTIEGTANHRVCTLAGWKTIGELRPGDRIGLPRSLPSTEDRLNEVEIAAAAIGSEVHHDVLGKARLSNGRGAPTNPVAEPVTHLAESDIWWDEIVSIEPAGEQETYDLQIPGDACFVADDMIVHNSAIVANMAENISMKYGMPVAFFSLEMSEVELAQRFIACRARIPGDRLRKGKVSQRDWPKVVRACAELERAPLWIDDSSDLGLLDLRAKARRLHAQEQDKGGLGAVIVDYMQLMRADDPRANRVEQVGQMSRGLKILARELEIPVIALSQLSRAPEQRPDKRPILSDLRESGCLTADSRVFLPDTGGSARIGDLEGQRGFRVLALNRETRQMEPAAVTAAFCTGTKPTLRMQTKLERGIGATGNHRFLTMDGWRRLDELRPGDRIALPTALPTPGAESDVYWDEIVSIGAGEAEPVFDLTVEGLHNFVANDIVVHNSIEQDADVVAFLYRDEYYNHDSEDEGLAELIISKHRNGPIGTTKLAFLSQFPKFMDQAQSDRPIEQPAGEGPPMAEVAEF